MGFTRDTMNRFTSLLLGALLAGVTSVPVQVDQSQYGPGPSAVPYRPRPAPGPYATLGSRAVTTRDRGRGPHIGGSRPGRGCTGSPPPPRGLSLAQSISLVESSSSICLNMWPEYNK